METPAIIIESLFERIEEYGKTTFELSKLRALETTTIVATTLLSKLWVYTIISMFIIVLSVGVALFLGELLGKMYFGFFIVAGFFFVLGVVFYFFLHKWIKKPISNFIINQMLQ